jgi:hypothetical protein
MSAQTPHNPSSTPTQFRSKLGTYLTGVAIGFGFLGMVYYFKYQASQREKAQRAQETQQQDQRDEQSGVRP